jgi:hypothetical protein
VTAGKDPRDKKAPLALETPKEVPMEILSARVAPAEHVMRNAPDARSREASKVAFDHG